MRSRPNAERRQSVSHDRAKSCPRETTCLVRHELWPRPLPIQRIIRLIVYDKAGKVAALSRGGWPGMDFGYSPDHEEFRAHVQGLFRNQPLRDEIARVR